MEVNNHRVYYTERVRVTDPRARDAMRLVQERIRNPTGFVNIEAHNYGDDIGILVAVIRRLLGED